MTLNFSVWPADAVETLEEMARALMEVSGVLGATEIAQLRLLAVRTVLRGFSDAEVQACVSEALVHFADQESSVARPTVDAVSLFEQDSREFPVVMPALGETVTEGTVTRLLKSVGERVEVDEPLLEVSADELDAEVPAPVAGTVTIVLVEENEAVEVGTALCLIRADSRPRDVTSLSVESTAPNDIRFGTAFRPRHDSAGPREGSSSELPHVTPLVRKLLTDLGVELASVHGTGVGGRILSRDVKEAARLGATSIAMDAVGLTELGPARAPLLDHEGWSLHGESTVCFELIQRIALSVVADIPLRYLKIRVYDPDRIGALDVLLKLQDTHPDVYRTPAQTRGELGPLLDEVIASASSTSECITAHRVATLGELWRVEGRPSNSYVLLVILGYPSRIDVAAQQELIRLAKSAPATGVSIVVCADHGAEPEFGVDPSRLLEQLTSFEYRDARWRTDSIPSAVQVMRDRPPSVDEIQRILSDAVERQPRTPDMDS